MSRAEEFASLRVRAFADCLELFVVYIAVQTQQFRATTMPLALYSAVFVVCAEQRIVQEG